MRLQGKAALVTGSSSGIGEAIALRFAREGADVAVHYHREAATAPARWRREIAALGRKTTALGADVGGPRRPSSLVRDAHEALGRLDILVNNAGVEIREPFLEVTEAHYDLVLGLNLKGAFFAAQAAAKHHGRRRPRRAHRQRVLHPRGHRLPRVLHLRRVQGRRAHAHAHRLPGAGAARHHRQRHRPGRVATPINRRTLADGGLLQALEEVIPAGRLGEPGRGRRLAVYLASDEAAYVTGSTYVIDGGMSRWNKGL